jgi:MoaA/NifB/PqqE/SkfB family radical SAM enzyme
MGKHFDVQMYMDKAIKAMVGRAVISSLRNRAELAFFLRFRQSVIRAAKRRAGLLRAGKQVPPFLIASITSDCNLHCRGCYARSNGICHEQMRSSELACNQWESLFRQAHELGIAFILLAGGEPLLRPDVLSAAGSMHSIVFPIFTNGTMVDEAFANVVANHRNLVPIVSLEGDRIATDRRRGDGTYDTVMQALALLHQRKLFFGLSITVSKTNLAAVTSAPFIQSLVEHGCRIFMFIEYVPVDGISQELAIDEAERAELAHFEAWARHTWRDRIFISFPGDEQKMGGCLAAGRGFFHLNTDGSAESCPFSPYGDVNAAETSLAHVLDSPLFARLRSSGLVGKTHTGGCALFEHEDEVKRIAAM